MHVATRHHAPAACFHQDHLSAAAESRHKDDMILVIKRPGSSGIGSMIKPPQFLTGRRVVGISRLGTDTEEPRAAVLLNDQRSTVTLSPVALLHHSVFHVLIIPDG